MTVLARRKVGVKTIRPVCLEPRLDLLFLSYNCYFEVILKVRQGRNEMLCKFWWVKILCVHSWKIKDPLNEAGAATKSNDRQHYFLLLGISTVVPHTRTSISPKYLSSSFHQGNPQVIQAKAACVSSRDPPSTTSESPKATRSYVACNDLLSGERSLPLCK